MDASNFPTAQATVVLMNPPFLGKSKPSSKSKQEFYDRGKEGQDDAAVADKAGFISVQEFIDRGLEGLQDGGRLLSIVPDGVLFGVGEVRLRNQAYVVTPVC